MEYPQAEKCQQTSKQQNTCFAENTISGRSRSWRNPGRTRTCPVGIPRTQRAAGRAWANPGGRRSRIGHGESPSFGLYLVNSLLLTVNIQSLWKAVKQQYEDVLMARPLTDAAAYRRVELRLPLWLIEALHAEAKQARRTINTQAVIVFETHYGAPPDPASPGEEGGADSHPVAPMVRRA
jgi:hypothetical protein